MPRSASAGGSSRSATRLSAPSGSPAASKRAAEATRESMAADYYGRCEDENPDALEKQGRKDKWVKCLAGRLNRAHWHFRVAISFTLWLRVKTSPKCQRHLDFRVCGFFA